MFKWTYRDNVIPNLRVSPHRRVSSLLIILFIMLIFVAYLEHHGIQDYSRYHWLKGNRELLGLTNSAANSSPLSLSPHELTPLNEATKSTQKCTPKFNIVFLKTHKCASSTIQNIFMRYGYTHNKVFVLPKSANYLGHPKPFHASMVPDPYLFGHDYNILAHHTRLDYLAMSSLMPKDTLFVTIVRNPIDLFESMFQYYRLNKLWNITIDDFNSVNFKIPQNVYTDRYIGKIGINQMIFDLGLNATDFQQRDAVVKHIEKLDSIFDLVMLSEQMDESLVLLKHLLCWSTDDIVVFKLNARRPQDHSNLSEVAHSKIKSLNWADNLLYRYFRHKFVTLVNAFGEENMRREVNELRNRIREWYNYCVFNEPTERTDISINNNKTLKKLPIIRFINKQRDNATCWLLTAQELDFTKFLRMRQIRLFPGSLFTTQHPLALMMKKRLKWKYNKSQLFHPNPGMLGIWGLNHRLKNKNSIESVHDSAHEMAIALEGKKAKYW